MVTGYNLKMDKKSDKFSDYVMKGETDIRVWKEYVYKQLRKYTIDGIADGTKIENDWFPSIDADVFISHSHQDETLAMGLAGWLNDTFGLKCFVDSCVWGHADGLIEIINDDFSDKVEKADGSCLYNHKKCNTASKHVNIMLAMALQKMIDKTEVTILLNTDNSISSYFDVYKEATYSPWIYSEIICTQIVRKRPISEYRKKQETMYNVYKNMYESSGFGAAYEVSLEHLKPLDELILDTWERMYKKKPAKYALDYLYKLTHPEDTDEMRLDEELFS